MAVVSRPLALKGSARSSSLHTVGHVTVVPLRPPRPDTSLPDVLERRRDRCSREIRLELADWRTRTGGVYDLTREQQERLSLPGMLPSYGDFLPDFVIVLGRGTPSAEPDGPIAWDDLLVHAGGLQWSYLTDRPAGRAPLNASAAAKWHNLDTLLNGTYQQDPAPAWLLDLIADQTPWGHLVRRPD